MNYTELRTAVKDSTTNIAAANTNYNSFANDVEDFLTEQDIFFGKENISNEHFDLLVSILKKVETIEAARNEITAWINNNFDKQYKLKKLHARHKGIMEFIRDREPEWQFAWGTGSDFKFVFPDIGKEKDIRAEKIKICLPLELTKDFLLEHIRSHLTNKLKLKIRQLKLLIPLNFNGSHWLLAKISIRDGQVSEATLYDSLSSTNVKAKEAFTKALEELKVNSNSILFKEEGIQNDAFRCFDYTCRKIFQLTSSTTDNTEPAASLKEDKLRQNLATKIANQLGVSLISHLKPSVLTPLKMRSRTFSLDSTTAPVSSHESHVHFKDDGAPFSASSSPTRASSSLFSPKTPASAATEASSEIAAFSILPTLEGSHTALPSASPSFTKSASSNITARVYLNNFKSITIPTKVKGKIWDTWRLREKTVALFDENAVFNAFEELNSTNTSLKNRINMCDKTMVYAGIVAGLLIALLGLVQRQVSSSNGSDTNRDDWFYSTSAVIGLLLAALEATCGKVKKDALEDKEYIKTGLQALKEDSIELEEQSRRGSQLI